jgi:hypothetical protein
MISLLIGLLLWANERIYSGTLAYSSQVEQVAISRQWAGYQSFDVLLATENCNDLARWAWVIVDGRVYDGLIVDCSHPSDRQQMIDNGLVADMNLRELNGEWAWVIIR